MMEQHVKRESECQQLEGIHWKEATWQGPVRKDRHRRQSQGRQTLLSVCCSKFNGTVDYFFRQRKGTSCHPSSHFRTPPLPMLRTCVKGRSGGGRDILGGPAEFQQETRVSRSGILAGETETVWEQEESRPSPRPFAETREERVWEENQGFFKHEKNRGGHEMLRGAVGLRHLASGDREPCGLDAGPTTSCALMKSAAWMGLLQEVCREKGGSQSRPPTEDPARPAGHQQWEQGHCLAKNGGCFWKERGPQHGMP